MKKALLATGILLSVGAFMLWPEPEPLVRAVGAGDVVVLKTQREAATDAGKDIAALGSIPRTNVGDFDIEVVNIVPIDGGVELYVKAWIVGKTYSVKDSSGITKRTIAKNSEVGFGKDGSVEVERIRSFNPPILVDDPLGPIVFETSTTTDVLGFVHPATVRRYRKDPTAATLKDLAHTLRVKQEVFNSSKIVVGKIGNTTDTFRSLGGSNDPVDGRYWRGSVSENFATIRAGNGSAAEDTQSDGYQPNFVRYNGSNAQYLMRGMFIFDTSAIATTDTVSSATYSWKCYQKWTDVGSPDVHAYYGTTAANNTLAASDYQSNGSVSSLGSNSNASITCNTTAASAAFNDIAFSSLTGVNKGTGARTKVGTGLSWDVLNDTTGLSPGSGIKDSGFAYYFADYAGTDHDPKLVVEHAAAGGAAPDDTYWNII